MSTPTCTVCWNPYVLPHICGPRPADRPTTDHGAAGFCTDHAQPALDVVAIRARAEDFREAIEASSDRVGVRAIKGARDVPALLDALATRDAEVEWLRATVARVAALLPAVWRVNETPFVFADDIEAALVAAPSETETGR